MHLFVGSLLVLAGLACLRYVWAGVPAFEREPPFLALGVLLIGIGAGLGVRARTAHLLARAGLGAGLLAIVVMIARLYLPSGARDHPDDRLVAHFYLFGFALAAAGVVVLLLLLRRARSASAFGAIDLVPLGGLAAALVLGLVWLVADDARLRPCRNGNDQACGVIATGLLESAERAPSATNALHLGEAAIHEQFRSRDVAAVVGGEEHHGLRDLVRRAEPAEWNTAGNGLDVFIGGFAGMPWGRIGVARAHRVHANASILQARRPCPRERTHGGFGGAVHTPLRRDRSTGDDGRIQDDRGAIRQQRKRLSHREKHAFHVAVEQRVVVLLGNAVQGSEPRAAGIGEHDIELALLALDLGEQPIEIAEVRHVSSYAGYISSDFLYRPSQLRLTAPRDEDVGAFIHELLRRRPANTAVATGHECDFSIELTHIWLLGEERRAPADVGPLSARSCPLRRRPKPVGFTRRQ